MCQPSLRWDKLSIGSSTRHEWPVVLWFLCLMDCIRLFLQYLNNRSCTVFWLRDRSVWSSQRCASWYLLWGGGQHDLSGTCRGQLRKDTWLRSWLCNRLLKHSRYTPCYKCTIWQIHSCSSWLVISGYQWHHCDLFKPSLKSERKHNWAVDFQNYRLHLRWRIGDI